MITIYHNPACGTSRNVLAAIRASGSEPAVVEYLQAPLDAEALRTLIAASGMSVRDALRVKGTPFAELGLDDPALDDAHLLGQIVRHPILLNRPFVVSAAGARLCRPSDLVLDLLPTLPPAGWVKQDGTPLLRDSPVTGTDPGLHDALRNADLPVDDLTEAGRTFYRYSALSGETVGFGGIEPCGKDVLLRSVAVPVTHRRQGIGRSIVPLLLRRAFDDGARRAWLLTTGGSAFFGYLGFRPADRATAPAAILATRQATTLCPGSATLMTRSITP